MVIALLIMAALAVAGLLVTNDAVMESRVGRNYAIHKQTVAAAEAAGKETMQAIQSIVIDPNNTSAADVKKALVGQSWRPYDGINTTFDFDVEELRDETGYIRTKPSVLESAAYVEEAKAIAVAVDEPAVISGSLGGMKVPGFFKYDIYSRAVHTGAGNNEVILMIGFQQKYL